MESIPATSRSVPSLECPTISNVPLTKSHFLDAYSKAKWNLSDVPCPPCFKGVELMCPPDHYNEASRLKAVKKYMSNEQWRDSTKFQKIISMALKQFHVKGASISLVDAKRQVIKYEASLQVNDCPRRISIDAHTILSNGSFVLLDASKDWRTSTNPFVTDSPYVHFYAGVPLVTSYGTIIGALAIFDCYPRNNFDELALSMLKDLASQVMTILNTPVSHSLPKAVTSNTVPLIKMIGRPTSHKHAFSNIALYERDGSGSQYGQNHNFMYNKQEASLLQNDLFLTDDILHRLIGYRDIRTASVKLCEIIKTELKFDFVFVVELRTSQQFQISPKYFPQCNVVNAESFNKAKKLIGKEKQQLKSRILGFAGGSESDMPLDSEFFYGALRSEFGIFYEAVPTHASVKLHSGICMQFYRFGSKLVRRVKVLKAERPSSKNKPIDVYLRSGGYLIAAFNDEERRIDDSLINFIYGASCSLRRLFIAN